MLFLQLLTLLGVAIALLMLSGISQTVSQLVEGVDIVSKELDDLTAQVKANTDLEASAIQLITGLAAQIAAAAGDPAKVVALATQLKTSADSLAAAITANTPAAG